MGSKTQTTKNKTTLPAYLEQTYKGLINAGSAAARAPMKQYTGPRLAGFTPMQQQAFQLTQNAQGMGIPYLNAASQAIGNSTATATGQNLQPYMDPWIQNVIDSTMANINKSNAVAQQGLKGSGLGAGVSPTLGDRMGLAQAELERNQAMARNQTIAGLESQGYQNAQSVFGSDMSRMQQAGGAFAGLGQQAQDQTYQGISQLLQQGGQQQQLGQTQLDQAYQQFQDQQNYPKSQIEWLANLAYGSPHGSTQTSTSPAPSLLSQLAGLATAGVGAAKTFGGIKRGGAVQMDSGGAVPAPTIAAPMLSPSSFTYSGGFGFAPPPTGPGVHIPSNEASSGMYINALPRLAPYGLMPKSGPVTVGIPKGILRGLNSIPYFSTKPKDLEANKKSAGGAAEAPWAHMASGGDPWRSPYFDTDFAEMDAPPTAPDYSPEPAAPAAAAPPPGQRPYNWGMPVMMAGLGMMASSSPYPLQAIGEGAMAGMKTAMDLDKNPVVDDTGPTIRVYYPSEHKWEDTGIPSTNYSALQLKRQLLSQTPVPLTDAEIAQQQIPAEAIAKQGRPYWDVTPTGKVVKFPVSGGGINFLPGETAQEKGLGEGYAKRQDAIAQSATASQETLANVSQIRSLLHTPGVFQGKGAGTVNQIKAWGKQLFPGLDWQGVAEPQAAAALMNQFALKLRNPGSGAGMPGSLSDSDRNFLSSMAPRMENDPRGNDLIMDWTERVAIRNIEIERLRERYAQSPTDYYGQPKGRGLIDSGFDEMVNDWAQKHPIVPPAEKELATKIAASSAVAPAPAPGLTDPAGIR